jgi:hypothetical protein
MAKETMRLPLHRQIAIALVLGVVAGFTLGEAAGYFEFLGVIFMRALPMIMAPLVFSSLVVGVSAAYRSSVGRHLVRGPLLSFQPPALGGRLKESAQHSCDLLPLLSRAGLSGRVLHDTPD